MKQAQGAGDGKDGGLGEIRIKYSDSAKPDNMDEAHLFSRKASNNSSKGEKVEFSVEFSMAYEDGHNWSMPIYNGSAKFHCTFKANQVCLPFTPNSLIFSFNPDKF